MAKAKKVAADEAQTETLVENTANEQPIENTESAVEVKEEILNEAPEVKPEPVVEIPKPVYRKELDKNAPHNERIVAFIKSRGTNDFVPINDFLKSLFPLPLPGAQPEWKKQETSKYLKGLITRMVEAGEITVKNQYYQELGGPYYPDGQIETQYKTIATVLIEAKLA